MPVTTRRPTAEMLFEEYLDDHGYEWEHEPDLGIPTVPDYAVRRNEAELVCEIKQFCTQAIRELGESAGGPVAVPPKLLYGTIRAQIDAAARQLKPLAGRGIPLVIILANPARATVTLDPGTLFHAMYGGGHWALPQQLLPSIDQWPIPSSAGRDGALTTKHAYISAVGGLRGQQTLSRFAPTEHPGASQNLEVVESLSDRATPLPANVFDGSADARWAPDEGGRYRQTAGIQRAGSIPEPEYADGFTWLVDGDL